MADKAFNTYPDDATPAGTWTVLCYPGSGNLKQPTLAEVFTAMVGANYSRTLALAGALGTAYTQVQEGTGAAAVPLKATTTRLWATNDVYFSGVLAQSPNGTTPWGAFSVDATGSVRCNNLAASGSAGFCGSQLTFTVDGSNNPIITIEGLGTVDPHVLGQLWNSSGTLKISAG